MTRTIYLPSYDRSIELLEYHLPKGQRILREGSAGLPITQGAFTREDPHITGIFATPQGPVFFFDSQHVLLRFGKTSASVTKEPDRPVMHFALTVESDRGETHAFALRYAERRGHQGNGDLLATIASGLRSPRFFESYTKAWL